MNKSLSLRTYEAFHSFMYHLRTNPIVLAAFVLALALVVGVFAIAFGFFEFVVTAGILLVFFTFIGSLNWVESESNYMYADSNSDFDDMSRMASDFDDMR